MGDFHSPRIVTDGLVCYYDASNPSSYTSGSTKIYDLSGNGYDGTGSILRFEPTFNTYISMSTQNIGTILPISGIQDYTVEIGSRIRYEIFAAYLVWGGGALSTGLVVRGGSAGSDAVDAWMGYLDTGSVAGQVNFALGASMPTALTSSTNFSVSVFFVSSSGFYGAYRNGIMYRTGSVGANFQKWNITNSASNAYYQHISFMRIYNRTLSPTEIKQNYDAQKSKFGLI